MNNRNRRVRASLLAAAALVALTTGTQAADRPAKFAVASGQMQALGIQTSPLQARGDAVRASFPAQVVVPPNAEQIISSPLPGLVAQLLVQQNQTVRAGTPLVRIVSPELGQLQLQLLKARARANLARQTARREQQLFDEGIIPQRRVQESQANLSEGEAALQQAMAALRLAGMPTAAIDRVAASGTLQDSVTLTATHAGLVTEIAVKTGQRVDSASLLVRIAQTATLWLDIQVPVTESARWQPGTRVKVQGRDIAARIVSAGASVSASSQTVLLRAVIEGQGGQVRPGEVLTVELPISAEAASWDLPLSAVAHDGNQAYVFVRTQDGFDARAPSFNCNSSLSCVE